MTDHLDPRRAAVTHLLCLTTSYPHERQMSAGCFVRRLNQLTQRELRSPAGCAPELTVVTMWRGSRLTAGDGDREQVRYARPVGDMFKRGAPDWVSAHPIMKLLVMPLNGWRLYAKHRAVSRQMRRQVSHKPNEPRAVVLAHWAVPCGWIARGQAPIVYCHGGDVALLESIPGGAALARAISRRVSAVVCVSADLTERWRALTQRDPHRERGGREERDARVFTIPMGVERPDPSPEARARWEAIIGDRLCIATVGRLDTIKGYDLLVEALGALKPELRAKICWLAAGDGPERDALTARADELSVSLTTLGELSPPERDALLAVAPLFIAPSRQVGRRVEGAPLALREAALSGCSIIATALGGVPELARELNQELDRVGRPPAVTLCAPTVDSLSRSLMALSTMGVKMGVKMGVRDLSEMGVRDLSETGAEMGVRDLSETGAETGAKDLSAIPKTGVRDLSPHRANISVCAQRLWSWESLESRHLEVIRSVIKLSD